MKTKTSKMSLMGAIAMTIGSIIGSGVFVFLPYGISLIGNQILWGLLFTMIFVSLKQLPATYMQSAIPVSASSYVYLAKFVHPTVAFVQCLNAGIGMLNVAIMSKTFSQYFCQLVGQSDNASLYIIIAASICIALAVLGYFGARLTGNVQNIIVLILIAALITYIIGGFGYDANYATFGEMLVPTFKFGIMWAAVGFLNYCLAGGAVVASFAEEVENPGFTVPFSFIAGTIFVTILYMFIAYVTVKSGPSNGLAATDYNAWVLGPHAAMFLSPSLTAFFLTGGALFATATTLNASYMIYSRMIFAAARDKIWPSVFAKKNKYNVPYVTLILVCCVSLVVILFQVPTTSIMKLVSVPALLLAFMFYIPILKFPKIYPHSARHAWFRLPYWLTVILVIFAVTVSFLAGGAVFSRLTTNAMIGMVVFYGLGFVYYYFRFNYLKKNGVDLIAAGRLPIPGWNENEAKYKAIDDEADKAAESKN